MGGKFEFSGFDREEREDYKIACGMTDRECEVFEARAKTGSRIAAAQMLNMSDTTVSRISRSVHSKIIKEMHKRERRRSGSTTMREDAI